MKNKINELFERKSQNILSVYFTAGYPDLDSTRDLIGGLESSGVDLIEIGIPFSDPLADGPTIQKSSEIALKNGMSIKLLFEQLRSVQANVPLILMGYLNPVMQYGAERFCSDAAQLGISGCIIPDLPLQIYLDEYKALFEKYGLKNILLITPQTSEERIRLIDEHSDSFIYMVSSASTTGAKVGVSKEQEEYFRRIQKMGLRNPLLTGFGISGKHTFRKACEYSNGAIIGSAFIKALGEKVSVDAAISSFIRDILREEELSVRNSFNS